MNPLSLRTSSLNNFTSSVISKTVLFGNSYSTLTIWLEKDCERTYQRRFSRAVIKTAMTGIRSAGSFLFPRAHKWKDLLPKAFACRPIIIADFFRKCISCLKCTNSVLLKRVTSAWHKMEKSILSRGSGSNCPVLLPRCVLLLSGVKRLCRPLSAVPDFGVGGCWDRHGSLLLHRWETCWNQKHASNQNLAFAVNWADVWGSSMV